MLAVIVLRLTIINYNVEKIKNTKTENSVKKIVNLADIWKLLIIFWVKF